MLAQLLHLCIQFLFYTPHLQDVLFGEDRCRDMTDQTREFSLRVQDGVVSEFETRCVFFRWSGFSGKFAYCVRYSLRLIPSGGKDWNVWIQRLSLCLRRSAARLAGPFIKLNILAWHVIFGDCQFRWNDVRPGTVFPPLCHKDVLSIFQ